MGNTDDFVISFDNHLIVRYDRARGGATPSRTAKLYRLEWDFGENAAAGAADTAVTEGTADTEGTKETEGSEG